jgi:hypothetical protein
LRLSKEHRFSTNRCRLYNSHFDAYPGVEGMKKWIILIGIVAIILIGGYLSLSFYAVKFIRAKLQSLMGPGLTVAGIQIKPTCLSATKIVYEDPQSNRQIFQVEEMNIYPDLLSSLKGSLRIREWRVCQPSFFFSRSREEVFVGPWMGHEEESKEKEGFQEEKKREPIHIRIDRIRIEKGSFDFEDMKPERVSANIQLRDIDLEINDIQFPFVSSHSPIQFNSKLKGKMRDGKIHATGWIDMKTMDMAISLGAQEIDVKIFEPYYQKRISAEIESGYINMESNIAVENRMIDAPGHLELLDLHIQEGGGTVLWIPAKTLVSLLRDKGNRIKVEFHVKGNLDDPQFNLQETFLTRIAISLAEALGIPIKVVGKGVIKGTEKGAEGLIEGVKSLEELFKKKKEKRK